jgi:RNA polymerase sigma-70 factor (ECF subfamily)
MAQLVNLEPGPATAEAAEPRGVLELARAGDTEAFGELCRAYETRLLRQANTLCGSAAQAEELAQDTLVQAWKSLHRYNGRCRFFTWLCAILLHRHRNMLRHRRPLLWWALAEPAREEFSTHAAHQTAVETGPDEAVQSREREALLRNCVAALPRKHQQVIYLRFFVDESLERIAALVGCSVGTVKSRLFHGLEKLRRMKELQDNLKESRSKVDVL